MNEEFRPAGAIFVMDGGGSLVELRAEPYSSEELLQQLLGKHPNLLAGEQIDSISPRRWIMVSREMPVPDSDGGSGRWAVDHLLLDQDGIPTLVEVKRSTDTRIRREVVGQMLDYAANGVSYWPAERIRAQFEAQSEDPEAALDRFLGDDGDPDAFWDSVTANLKTGRIRMLFVADEIPMELRRIIEFLNEQMNPAEVLGVEVKQYTGGGLRTLVPRVIGQTAEAQHKRGSGGSRKKRQWDEASFFEVLEESRGSEIVAVARSILDWAKARQLSLQFGTGAIQGSVFPWFQYGGADHSFLCLDTGGGVGILFDMLLAKKRSRFSREQLESLRERLNQVQGFNIPTRFLETRTYPSLSHLTKTGEMNTFLAALDWVVDQIRGGNYSTVAEANSAMEVG